MQYRSAPSSSKRGETRGSLSPRSSPRTQVQSFVISANKKDISVETALRGGRGKLVQIRTRKMTSSRSCRVKAGYQCGCPQYSSNFQNSQTHCSPYGLIMSQKVDGRPCNITVDTGSNISIIRPDILTESTRESLETSTQLLCTVTGETAPAQLPVSIAPDVGSCNS